LISGERVVEVIKSELKDSGRRHLRNQEDYESQRRKGMRTHLASLPSVYVTINDEEGCVTDVVLQKRHSQ
jgi:hypothetical protein